MCLFLKESPLYIPIDTLYFQVVIACPGKWKPLFLPIFQKPRLAKGQWKSLAQSYHSQRSGGDGGSSYYGDSVYLKSPYPTSAYDQVATTEPTVLLPATKPLLSSGSSSLPNHAYSRPHPVIGIQKQVDRRYPRIVLGLLRHKKARRRGRNKLIQPVPQYDVIYPYENLTTIL